MSDDLTALADSFREAAGAARHETQQVVSKGALNIKNDWRKGWRAMNLRHTPRLWRSVGYDLTSYGDTVMAVIGPNVDDHYNQGPLGGVIEEGTVNNAPRPAGTPALLSESPRFEDALGAMGERLADGR